MGGRLFAALDPTQLEQCFINRTAGIAKAGGGELVAMNLLRRDQTIRVGLNAKRKRAGWDHTTTSCT